MTPVVNFATLNQWYCWYWWQPTSVNNTGGKFVAGVNDTVGKLLPASTTPAVNLTPVSWPLVANNGNNIRLLTPLSDLKEQIYLYVNSTTQRCPNKLIKLFWFKIFCHLPLGTSAVNISVNFWKNWNALPNGMLRGLGETDSWKNLKSKFFWHFNVRLTWIDPYTFGSLGYRTCVPYLPRELARKSFFSPHYFVIWGW